MKTIRLFLLACILAPLSLLADLQSLERDPEQVGYTGTMDVVYFQRSEKRIAALIPGFQVDRHEKQVLPQLGLTFHPFNDWVSVDNWAFDASHEVPNVELAITGADDGFYPNQETVEFTYLAECFRQGAEPQSEISTFYRSLRQKNGGIANDKLLRGIDMLWDIARQQGLNHLYPSQLCRSVHTSR